MDLSPMNLSTTPSVTFIYLLDLFVLSPFSCALLSSFQWRFGFFHLIYDLSLFIFYLSNEKHLKASLLASPGSNLGFTKKEDFESREGGFRVRIVESEVLIPERTVVKFLYWRVCVD